MYNDCLVVIILPYRHGLRLRFARAENYAIYNTYLLRRDAPTDEKLSAVIRSEVRNLKKRLFSRKDSAPQAKNDGVRILLALQASELYF